MTTAVHGRRSGRRPWRRKPHGAAEVRGAARVDLRGLDYYARRRRLLSALRDLAPGDRVQVISDRADEVVWLRYEVEARVAERYGWSLPDEGDGAVCTTARRMRRSAPAR
jgi:uncharacterized protein (DUF2249 family)